MTNVIPFERKKPKYQEASTVNNTLEGIAIKESYDLLKGVLSFTSSNTLKNDINCVLGVMRDEFKCLRE